MNIQNPHDDIEQISAKEVQTLRTKTNMNITEYDFEQIIGQLRLAIARQMKYTANRNEINIYMPTITLEVFTYYTVKLYGRMNINKFEGCNVYPNYNNEITVAYKYCNRLPTFEPVTIKMY